MLWGDGCEGGRIGVALDEAERGHNIAVLAVELARLVRGAHDDVVGIRIVRGVAVALPMLYGTSHQAVLEIIVDIAGIGAAYVSAQTHAPIALEDGACVGTVVEEAVIGLSNILYRAHKTRSTPRAGCVVLSLFLNSSAKAAVADGKGTIVRKTADEASTVGRFRGIAPEGAAEFASRDYELALSLHHESTQGIGAGADVDTHLYVLNGGWPVYGINHASHARACFDGAGNLEVLDYRALTSGANQGKLVRIGKVVRNGVSLSVQRTCERAGKGCRYVEVAAKRDGPIGVCLGVGTYCLPVLGRIDGNIVGPNGTSQKQ